MGPTYGKVVVADLAPIGRSIVQQRFESPSGSSLLAFLGEALCPEFLNGSSLLEVLAKVVGEDRRCPDRV